MVWIVSLTGENITQMKKTTKILKIFFALSVLILIVLPIHIYRAEIIYLFYIHVYQLFIFISAMLFVPIILNRLDNMEITDNADGNNTKGSPDTEGSVTQYSGLIDRTTTTKVIIFLFLIGFMIVLNMWIDQLNNSNRDSSIKLLGMILFFGPMALIVAYQILLYLTNSDQHITSNLGLAMYSLMIFLSSIGLLLFITDIISSPMDSKASLIVILIIELAALVGIQIPEPRLLLIFISLKFKHGIPPRR